MVWPSLLKFEYDPISGCLDIPHLIYSGCLPLEVVLILRFCQILFGHLSISLKFWGCLLLEQWILRYSPFIIFGGHLRFAILCNPYGQLTYKFLLRSAYSYNPFPSGWVGWVVRWVGGWLGGQVRKYSIPRTSIRMSLSSGPSVAITYLKSAKASGIHIHMPLTLLDLEGDSTIFPECTKFRLITIFSICLCQKFDTQGGK